MQYHILVVTAVGCMGSKVLDKLLGYKVIQVVRVIRVMGDKCVVIAGSM